MSEQNPQYIVKGFLQNGDWLKCRIPEQHYSLEYYERKRVIQRFQDHPNIERIEWWQYGDDEIHTVEVKNA